MGQFREHYVLVPNTFEYVCFLISTLLKVFNVFFKKSSKHLQTRKQSRTWFENYCLKSGGVGLRLKSTGIQGIQWCYLI